MNAEERKKIIENFENQEPTTEQERRKKQSIAYCQEHEVPVLQSLPVIQCEEQTELRSQADVLYRCLCLMCLGLKSEGLEDHYLIQFIEKHDLKDHFTPMEVDYITNPNPDPQENTNANWRYEGANTLLWALGFIDKLPFPSQICNVKDDVSIVFNRTPEQFDQEAKLRSKSEILDQADLIYRLDWACVDARVNQKETPADMNPSVVYERHYTLNWLINYAHADWDTVSTDT